MCVCTSFVFDVINLVTLPVNIMYRAALQVHCIRDKSLS